MQIHERKAYLYDVLTRQPMNPIPMKIIRNSKAALNAKIGTHVKNMSRISQILRDLEKRGKIRRNFGKEHIVSKKYPRGIDIEKVYSITVLNKSVDTDKKK